MGKTFLNNDQTAAAEAIDAMLAAWLRSEPFVAKGLAPTEAILARIDHHGVAGLLFHAHGTHSGPIEETIAQALRQRAISQSFWEDAHREHLLQVIAALHAAGASPLLFKGSALAYSLYSDPMTRLRGDSDLIVAPEHFTAACAALETAGYTSLLPSRGTLVASTMVFGARDRRGHRHEFDLHQRISNSAALGRLFTFKELHARSQPLTALSPEALAVGDCDALLIACFHRQVHAESPYFINGIDQHDPDRMIWLADVDRLTRRLTPGDWTELTTLCQTKGLSRVVCDGLEAAERILRTPLPRSALGQLAAQRRDTLPTRYLAAGAGRRALLDLSATQGVTRKLRYLSQLVFPAPAYVRAMFPAARTTWLPWLYARYIVGRSLNRLASLRR